MRVAAFVLWLFVLRGVATAQIGPAAEPATTSYNRPSFFVGPSYRSTGDNFYVAPRPANAFSITRSSQAGNEFSSGARTWVNSSAPRSHATYFRNPYYPSLSFTPPVDIRPQEYVIPPVTQTPLHDPYFEERVFEEFDDAYEYWGW